MSSNATRWGYALLAVASMVWPFVLALAAYEDSMIQHKEPYSEH